MVKVKKTRMMIIGLFVLMGILFNITVYFDNSGAQDSDFALSDLRVSLVNKAYASADPSGCWLIYCPDEPNGPICGTITSTYPGGSTTRYCRWGVEGF